MPITINHLPTPISHFTQNNQQVGRAQIVEFKYPFNVARKFGIRFQIATSVKTNGPANFVFTDHYVYYSRDGSVKQRAEYLFDDSCMFNMDEVTKLYNSFTDFGEDVQNK